MKLEVFSVVLLSAVLISPRLAFADDENQVQGIEEDIDQAVEEDMDADMEPWAEDMKEDDFEIVFAPVGSAARDDARIAANLANQPSWEQEPAMPSLETLPAKRPPPAAGRQSSGSLLTCGSRRLNTGYYWIRSPSYPNVYPNGQFCEYTVYPPYNGVLSFSCYKFKLENSTGCTKDFLAVFSRRYCGTSAPTPLFDYSYLRLTFRSDCDVEEGGFNCVVQTKQRGYGAGGLPCGSYSLRPGNYTIRSDNYPSQYNNLRYCRWYLRAASTSDRLTTTCTTFDMEPDSECSYDYLSVNGRRFCGTTAPSGTSTYYYQIYIFSTDYSYTRPGFSCTISVGLRYDFTHKTAALN